MPLSRQQIREILDRNAQAINRARGPNGDLEHIVGTKSLVDAETAATRAAKRNAVNQALADMQEDGTLQKIWDKWMVDTEVSE